MKRILKHHPKTRENHNFPTLFRPPKKGTRKNPWIFGPYGVFFRRRFKTEVKGSAEDLHQKEETFAPWRNVGNKSNVKQQEKHPKKII